MLEDDAIDGVLLYLRDVTEIRERTRRFEGIFNQTFQLTGLLNTDGTVLEMNDSALEFSNFGPDALQGETFDELTWWEHSEQDRQQVAESLDRAARGNFVRYETRVCGADGLRTFDLSIKPVHDSDGVVSFLVFEARDITDRQRRGQHLAVLERVMRHNIRNDLTKLRGWTQMLYEVTDDGDGDDIYATVQDILNKWETMTERTQQIKHLLDGQVSHQTQRPLAGIINSAVKGVRESAPDSDLAVEMQSGAEAHISVILQEAVGELMTNAIAASDDGPVTVQCARANENWVEIAVKDSGPGLPDAEASVLEHGEETL